MELTAAEKGSLSARNLRTRLHQATESAMIRWNSTTEQKLAVASRQRNYCSLNVREIISR